MIISDGKITYPSPKIKSLKKMEKKNQTNKQRIHGDKEELFMKNNLSSQDRIKRFLSSRDLPKFRPSSLNNRSDLVSRSRIKSM